MSLRYFCFNHIICAGTIYLVAICLANNVFLKKKTKLLVVIGSFLCKCMHLYNMQINLRENIKQYRWNEKESRN